MQLGTFTPAGQRDEHPLAAELRDAVVTADRTSPRSLQLNLGPSEIGEPCPRRLAYRLMDEKRHNIDGDPWAAIVGTSVHAWLADAFLAANTRLGRVRYLVETRVEVRPGLTGSCDLYDADTATVIDHKIVGPAKLKEYRHKGPPDQYRVQAHAYGLGFARLGLPVHHVALAFYPRGAADLSGLHVWAQPWDRAVIDDALSRHDTLLDLICGLDVEHQPDRYRLLPTVPGHRCNYCPWHKPGPDTGAGCPGTDTAPVTAPAA